MAVIRTTNHHQWTASCPHTTSHTRSHTDTLSQCLNDSAIPTHSFSLTNGGVIDSWNHIKPHDYRAHIRPACMVHMHTCAYRSAQCFGSSCCWLSLRRLAAATMLCWFVSAHQAAFMLVAGTQTANADCANVATKTSSVMGRMVRLASGTLPCPIHA